MGRTADAIAEGLSIANAAARLTVRNRILVDTIAGGDSYDPERFTTFTRDTLLALAEEQEKAGERAARQRKKAWGRYSDPDGTHDYRDRDTGNLRKRHRQYVGVAKGLRAEADDPKALQELLEESRDAAWHDVESNLLRRLVIFGAQVLGFGTVWVIRYLILDRWLFKITHDGAEPTPDDLDEMHGDVPI
jgi:hypothetical protein